MERFDLFVKWFGQFFDPFAGPNIINEVIRLMDTSWFHGDITSEIANSRLSGKTSGTFLIRLSHTDPKPFPFSLSLIENHHERIERVEGGVQLLGTIFPDLFELVKSYQQELTDACPKGYEARYGPTSTTVPKVQLDGAHIPIQVSNVLSGLECEPNSDYPMGPVGITYTPPTAQIDSAYAPNSQILFGGLAPTATPNSAYTPTTQIQINSVYTPTAQINSAYTPSTQLNSAFSPTTQIDYTPTAQINSAYAPTTQINRAFSPTTQMTDVYAPNAQIFSGLAPTQPNNYTPITQPTSQTNYAPTAHTFSPYSPNAQMNDMHSPTTNPNSGYNPDAQHYSPPQVYTQHFK
jgi:hypothetical protein